MVLKNSAGRWHGPTAVIAPGRRSRAGVAAVLALALAGSAITGAPSRADAQSGPVSEQLRSQNAATAYDRSFAPLVEVLRPTVVNVQVERTDVASDESGPLGDPDMQRFFERFFGQPMPNQPPRERPRRFRSRGEGSGFVIDPDGHIVTNAHVVNGSQRIYVVLQDGTRHPAKLKGVDEKTDLALVKIEPPKPLPYVAFGDSSKVRVGDKVIAVGNPFGLGGTVTTGIVSATGRELGSGPYDDFIQVDAPINRGNSGGPTFNLDGEVVGVNTLIFSPSGGSIGIGFAISSNLAKQVIADLKDDGKIRRGWLGVAIQELDADLVQSLGLPDTNGALVSRVEPGSPAEKAGIKAGEVILEFNGTKIDRLRALTRAVGSATPGKSGELVVWSDGKRRTVDVMLGEQPGAQQVAATESTDKETGAPRLGLALAQLTPQLRSRLGLDADVKGVIVQSVQPDSPAAEKGIEPGDIILSVAGKEVRTPKDVTEAVRKAHGDGQKTVLLMLQREGRQIYTAVPFAVS